MSVRWAAVSSELEGEADTPRILHCFADKGVESEVLSWYGDVVRVGIDPTGGNESAPIRADANISVEGKDHDIPFKQDVTFDLGVFHPVCSRWAATTSISGDADDHVNMIPSAHSIAERYCDYHIIENVPRAPLNDPIVLNGRMFGLPIEFERAFETSFKVPQPPQYKRFWARGEDQDVNLAETSSFFFTERTRRWWASAKGYPTRKYSKSHLAKNTIPAPYIHHLCRAWLLEYEQGKDIDYTDYDERMTKQRRQKLNHALSDFATDDDSSDGRLDDFATQDDS